MALILVTPPAEEPLTLAEVKKFIRIDHDYSDTDIIALIRSAREYAENYQHRKLITQTWDKYCDCWPEKDEIELLPSLQSVKSIKYFNKEGLEMIFSSSNYLVDTVSLVGKIKLKAGIGWPAESLQEVNGIKITFTCGYGDAAAVPELTKTAMVVYVSHRYYNREDELSKAVDNLLDHEKVRTA